MAQVPNIPGAGLLTGGREARNFEQQMAQEKANLRSTRLSNLDAAYKFQEYMANRKHRDWQAKSRTADAQINVATAPSRQQATESTNQVTHRQNQTTLRNEDTREQAQKAMLLNQKRKVDQEFGAADRNVFISADSFIEEAGGAEAIDEGTWGTIYNDLVNHLSGPSTSPQETAARLQRKFGLTPDFRPENLRIVQNIGRLAGHDKELWQKEHMAELEAYLKNRYSIGTEDLKWDTKIPKMYSDLSKLKKQYSSIVATSPNGANSPEARDAHMAIIRQQEAIDRFVSQEKYALMTTSETQLTNDLKLLDGAPGDAEDMNPNILPHYNQLMESLKDQYPSYISSDPVAMRRLFNQVYKYDPSSWYLGSRGNIVRKNPEEALEDQVRRQMEQQWTQDILNSLVVMQVLTPEQADAARSGITENVISRAKPGQRRTTTEDFRNQR